MPRKALLLAAGFGTRIQPLSDDLPKPLLPLWGVPVIRRVVDMMKRFGVREVLVNLHHRSGELLDYFRRQGPDGVKVNFSFEPDILGTGGALRRADWFVAGPEPFWIVNTDIAADVTPAPFLRVSRETGALAVLWMTAERGPRTVEMRKGVVVNFRSAHPRSAGTCTFCGLQLVSGRILNYVPDRKFSSVIEAYEAAMRRGERVMGLEVKRSFWEDIGTPEHYLDVHRRFLDRGLAGKGTARAEGGASGFVSAGKNVVIRPGARIRDSVLMDGAEIGPRARLNRAIVARDTRVNGPVSGIAMRCDRIAGEPELKRALSAMGWREEETTAVFLGARGSDRYFVRVVPNAGRSRVFIRHGTARAENVHYAAHARFLRREDVPVPGVVLDRPADRVAVVEDLGDTTLEAEMPGMSADERRRIYCRVIEAVAALHGIPAGNIRRAGVALEPPFTARLYAWEHALFAEHFLRGRLGMAGAEIRALRAELETVAGELVRRPRVLVHRDLQSSNILLKGGRPWFIDFQGMRLGPAEYDLASLLCDPYVMLEPDFQAEMLRAYREAVGGRGGDERTFWLAAVQRLAQALGAYGRLAALPGMARYSDYMEPALRMMGRALDHVEGLPQLKRVTRDRGTKGQRDRGGEKEVIGCR